MLLETVRCHALGTDVTRAVDFEGMADRAIWPECQGKGRAG
jgi:hypothetical protein